MLASCGRGESDKNLRSLTATMCRSQEFAVDTALEDIREPIAYTRQVPEVSTVLQSSAFAARRAES